jgi:hypothetical protein
MGAFLVGSTGYLPFLLDGCAFISCRGGGGERDLKREDKRKKKGRKFYGFGGCLPITARTETV